MLNETYAGINVESTLLNIIKKIHSEGPINPALLEELTYIKLFHNDIFTKYESSLINLLGLFYKTGAPETLLDEVYKIYSESIGDSTGHEFTPVQADAFRKIRRNRYFSFSSPTSSGKSFLFRHLINDIEGDCVIVLPSRALIAEYMKIVSELVDPSVLVLQFVDDINQQKTKRRIFIITPERGIELFKFSNKFNIELILLDEAHLSEEEIRGLKFDAFVRRCSYVFPKAKIVFSHPFVNNPSAQLKKHNFKTHANSMQYNQLVTGKVYLYYDNNQQHFFSPYNKDFEISLKNDLVSSLLHHGKTLLIYISKSKIYDDDFDAFIKYLNLCTKLRNKQAIALINALKEYIGASESVGSEKYSKMIDMMERGIVIHHGSMPLKCRFIIEDFIKSGYAKICLSTSTLNEGINMPFDVVIIDNFKNMDTLTLKNLIGRAGRTTQDHQFNYGYVFIREENRKTFIKRLSDPIILSESSLLDAPVSSSHEDYKDVIHAVKNNEFDDNLNLPSVQVERLKSSSIEQSIEIVLDNLMLDQEPISGNDYYNKISKVTRDSIKQAFRTIFIQHLRRKDLVLAEKDILSASIPILLWKIQGKSFKEIVSLRYSFLSERNKRREINTNLKKNMISLEEANAALQNLKVRYTPIPTTLPNINARRAPVFINTSVLDLSYDVLVFDTYDYLDKVLSISIIDPIFAAFWLYYERTHDIRAKNLANYIRFGTNDKTEIWLLRYGYSFEDIEWLKQYVKSINEERIVFKPSVMNLKGERLKLIEKYI